MISEMCELVLEAYSVFDDSASQLDAETAHFVRPIRFFQGFSLLDSDSLNGRDNREVRNESTAAIQMLRNGFAVKEAVRTTDSRS